jgi:ADP-heptose:LPS heptosyltransferase
MNLKKTIKWIGKCFIALNQEDERIIRQTILIVDNGYSWIGYLESAIERIKHYFPRAEVSVLTSQLRKGNLAKKFPYIKFILSAPKLRPRRYQIALQMLMLRKSRYDFVILLSLDITPLIVSMIFMRSKIILYNQWRQWWSLRLRNATEIFKVTYVKKRTKFNLKSLFKRIGLLFILLQRKDEESLKHSILIVDNGRALFKQIDWVIGKIKEYLPQARVVVLASEQRRELKDKFPCLEFIKSAGCVIKRYRIARHMLRLRKKGYDYIILLSLDITPIIVSILFMKSKVFLNNQWSQWWSLKPKPATAYLRIIPQFIFNIIIFIYLLIRVSWIFLKRSFNVFRFSLLKKKI